MWWEGTESHPDSDTDVGTRVKHARSLYTEDSRRLSLSHATTDAIVLTRNILSF